MPNKECVSTLRSARVRPAANPPQPLLRIPVCRGSLSYSARVGVIQGNTASTLALAATTVRGGQHLTGVARVNARLQKWSETDAVPCSHSSSTLQYSSGRLLLSCTRSAALDCPEYVRRRAGLPRPGRHSPDLPPPAACHHGPQRLPLPQAQCWRMRQACRDCHGRGPRIERHGRAAERGAETPRNVSDEAMRQARRWRFAARHA